MTPYVYIAVRSDLTPVQQLVQVAHSTHESGGQFGCPKHCHMVVFEVSDVGGLQKFCEVCGNSGIRYSLFYEPDNNLGYTAACTEPITGAIRSRLRRFQLLGGQIQSQQDKPCHQQA